MNLARLKLGTLSNCLGGHNHGLTACAGPAHASTTSSASASRPVGVDGVMMKVALRENSPRFGRSTGRTQVAAE